MRFRRDLNGWSMSVPAAFQIAGELRPVVLVRTLPAKCRSWVDNYRERARLPDPVEVRIARHFPA